jgi:hypothetical protein
MLYAFSQRPTSPEKIIIIAIKRTSPSTDIVKESISTLSAFRPQISHTTIKDSPNDTGNNVIGLVTRDKTKSSILLLPSCKKHFFNEI